MCFVHANFNQFFAVVEVIAMVLDTGGNISPFTKSIAFRTRLESGIVFYDHHKAQFVVAFMYRGLCFICLWDAVMQGIPVEC